MKLWRQILRLCDTGEHWLFTVHCYFPMCEW